ncbi:MAG: alanine--tRNA ligase [Gammaproteobacteria bacterium]|nr:alanine--tRNA ligase [Gammaproteobacteria bacterium]
MNGAEIREAFLAYFESKGHTRVASSSLVPGNDPTLLFTNAGMVQFKDLFLGREQRAYTRATSSQRCVRAGGKHNDLDNVGYTARHHTFFEMLGNFSFGDYFKPEAIGYGWEFLTGVLKLPRERLWVTVFEDDQEAERIWIEQIGVDPARVTRLGEKSNFWAMGDTGPCGPCTEIFYDHGPQVAGGPPGSPDEDGDRYIEIWNLVFMQYERAADGTLAALPKPSVDTGMGLERIAAVMQHVHSNYEIDLFRLLLDAAREVTGAGDPDSPSLRVIADHIRSCAFLVSDGVVPSNEGRGYVLRRILRRACRHGHKLGASEPFFHRLVAPLGAAMGDAYPELIEKRAQIERILLLEEEQFARTLDTGLRILEQDLAELTGPLIPGETLFKLYDTYGFPLDLTADIARERGLAVDEEGFERAMQTQRERARGASHFVMDEQHELGIDAATVFTGHESLQGRTKLVAIVRDGTRVERLEAAQQGILVLGSTPFYAEAGGQVGDAGVIELPGARFEVRDTTRSGAATLHHGVMVEGSMGTGAEVDARVEPAIRQATALNHSATHLLHAALREVLGTHVTQKGSLVDSSRLRFDFAHFEALTPAELRAVERLVNEQIRGNTPVSIEITDMDTAKARGAMALFGEKYGSEVRVLTMGGGFSVELCGGTHVQRTGDIGLLRITAEAGIAAGVRRIEALTGANALDLFDALEERNARIARLLKAGGEGAVEKLEQLIASNRQLEKELERLRARLASGSDLAAGAIEIEGIKVLAAQLDGADAKSLRAAVDQLKDKLGDAVVLLAALEGEKISLVAGVGKNVSARVPAGELVGAVAALVGGKGGGRPDMAQGGGTDGAALPAALASVPDWVRRRLAQ